MHTTTNFVLRFWLLILAALLAVLWLFKPVLLPFMAGLAIAYFLEPAVAALEKRKFPRWLGALFVLCGFLFVMASIFLLVWPMIDHQIAAMIEAMPDTTTRVREHYLPWVQNWLSRFSPEDVKKIREAATQSTGGAVSLVGRAVTSIVSGGVALIDAVALSILTSVTAFFVLRDWRKLTSTIDRLIPRKPYAVIREQIAEIDRNLSGFMRGQAIVCLILGIFYSLGLTLNGLQYGATVGVIAGILTVIPFVGTVFGWVMSFLLAAAQFDGDWLRIGLVVAVFVFGNFLESYVLTPRLVGKRVGLHPVWILFALVAGIKLLGFLGALIAVPSAAVVGVLARFGARQYKSSAIYNK